MPSTKRFSLLLSLSACLSTTTLASAADFFDDGSRFWDHYPDQSELGLGEAVGYAVPLRKAAASDGAVCIDGTIPYYYFAPGDGSGTNKFAIYFKGGGWCSGVSSANGVGFDSCLDRSYDTLGSSSTYTQYLSYGTNSYLDTNEAANPLMYNWNKVYLQYCDGASFGGNKYEPDVVETNGEKRYLYSRGHRILKAVYEDLLQFKGLANASDIVILGSSAGGLATWLHSDWIYDNLLKNVVSSSCKVSALPDSGYFLDYNGWEGKTNYSNGLKWVFNHGNLSYGSVNPDCIAHYGGQDSDQVDACVFAQNIAPFVQLPMFALNSEYDSWQTENILGSSNATIVNEYGQNFTKIMNEMYLGTNNASSNNFNHAAYLDSCHHHCGYWNGVKVGNWTQSTAHQYFYEQKVEAGANGEFLFRQNQSYPCSSCCS